MKPSIQVSDIKVIDISPKVKDKEIAKLLPNTLFPEKISFVLSKVNNAVSNALRRTIACELPVLAMDVEYDDIKSSDVFHIQEMIKKRLRMIPIDQKTPPDAVFELFAVNDTTLVRDVKSSEIKISRAGSKAPLKKLPFNETFTICTLQPGRRIGISDIGIKKAFCFNPGDGMHSIACKAVSLAVDQIPINVLDENTKGIPSRLADPRVWQIAFETHGTMPAKQIVAMACDNLITRVQSVLDSPEFNNGDYYRIVINGETDTIGNLYMRTICDLYPEIDFIVYSTPSDFTRYATLTIRHEDTPAILANVSKHLTETFTQIKSHFT